MSSEWLFSLMALTMTAGVGWLLYRWGRSGPSPVPELRVSWQIVIPRAARFGVAEATAWFASLSPLLPPGTAPSVELRGERGELVFGVSAVKAAEAVLRGQLTAWFPGARLEPMLPRPAGMAVQPLRLAKPALYPLRIPSLQEPDPLLGLGGVLTQGTGPAGLRLTWSPAPADWAPWAPAALAAVKQGQRLPPHGAWLWFYQAVQTVQAASAPAAPRTRSPASPAAALASATAKVQGPVFQAHLSVWATGRSQPVAEQRVRSLTTYLATAFRDPDGNALAAAGPLQWQEGGSETTSLPGPALVLSAGELAALFHVPAAGHPLLPGAPSHQVAPVPRLLLAQTRDPAITRLGEALTPAGPAPFGLGPEERRLHGYVTGKTGTGKSTLLATLIQQDLAAGRGVGLIDPHGDLAERVLALVPPERDDQVRYFNPADTEFPVGFNLLTATAPAERPLVASGVIAVFKKLHAEFWGPRLEHILRQAVLALLETPAPSLLLLPSLLTDRGYRQQVLGYVHDPVLRHFFEDEFERYDPRWRSEAIAPILNKVGPLLATPLTRHIIGQSQGGFRLRQVMDEGGIFIANLSSGRIGEDNAALLGGLLVAGFQLAAMARADQPEAARRDFYLTVDEFQHFSNDAFALILSEARKYRLALTLSHQYLGQLSPAMAEAVLGNVGSLAVFRVGAPDAARLVKELAPAFDLQDLVHLPNYQFCARLTHAGETLPAFSARTLPLPAPQRDPGPLLERSRKLWGRPRAAVELEIADLLEGRLD